MRGFSWPVCKILEEVREYIHTHESLIKQACMTGNLDAVKWLLADSVFAVPQEEAPWVVFIPMRMAALEGHMEVVKWLFDHFELATRVPPILLSNAAQYYCAGGADPGGIKWWIERSFVLPHCDLLSIVLKNNHASVKMCQWLKEQWEGTTEVHAFTLQMIKKPEVLKWALTTLAVSPDSDSLSEMCSSHGVDFAEWLTSERHFTPTTSTFILACCTARKDVSTTQLLRWLSVRVTLTPQDTIRSLIYALRRSNITIADWLESTFHVMESLNSKAGTYLVKICNRKFNYNSQSDGLKWFVSHLSNPEKVSASAVRTAISKTGMQYRVEEVECLLSSFPHCIPNNRAPNLNYLLEGLLVVFMNATLSKLQWFVSFLEPSLLTTELAARSLAHRKFHPHSTKVVKWVANKFHLRPEHIKANNNHLLFKMLDLTKSSGAEWLISSFDITLPEVVAMFDYWWRSEATFFDTSLATWRMLLNKFPGIDSSVIRQHMMPIVSNSPFTGTFTINAFGITIDEVRQYRSGQHSPNEGVLIWLGLS
ncbi:hypothetical protein Pelo_1788 [Pelomyxa schiedti]|nr:hypothetical protein Pelo_1788 [Pelomyxa schiedti]